jgi:hypothetical protein
MLEKLKKLCSKLMICKDSNCVSNCCSGNQLKRCDSCSRHIMDELCYLKDREEEMMTLFCIQCWQHHSEKNHLEQRINE